MSLPLQYVYLFGDLMLLIPWLVLFVIGKKVRAEMLTMSLIIGFVSVLTAYFWWTLDWWHPATITGTRVGIEDFLIGFASGGIMAVLYEVLFKKRYKKSSKSYHQLTGPVLLVILAVVSWLLWFTGVPSFWISVLALSLTALLLFAYRQDLLLNGMLSGALMVVVSLCFYMPVTYASTEWVKATYDFAHLSGILLLGVPIEEFVFWFFAGLFFGPFYEYWKQLKASD